MLTNQDYVGFTAKAILAVNAEISANYNNENNILFNDNLKVIPEIRDRTLVVRRVLKRILKCYI